MILIGLQALLFSMFFGIWLYNGSLSAFWVSGVMVGLMVSTIVIEYETNK